MHTYTIYLILILCIITRSLSFGMVTRGIEPLPEASVTVTKCHLGGVTAKIKTNA
jgi:hypothetical protein